MVYTLQYCKKEIPNRLSVRKLKVIVKEIFKEDEGKGIVRLDPEIIERLNLKIGDAIEIAHSTISNKTAALVYSGVKEDRKTNIIRMDKFSRRNLNVALDDLVKIGKIEDELAEDITFMGLIKPAKLKISQQLTRKLENRVFTMHDTLSINALGHRVDLIIVDYTPKADAVRIYLDTNIIIKEKSYKQLMETEFPSLEGDIIALNIINKRLDFINKLKTIIDEGLNGYDLLIEIENFNYQNEHEMYFPGQEILKEIGKNSLKEYIEKKGKKINFISSLENTLNGIKKNLDYLEYKIEKVKGFKTNLLETVQPISKQLIEKITVLKNKLKKQVKELSKTVKEKLVPKKEEKKAEIEIEELY